MGCLEGPDSFPEPRQQREVVRHATEQGLHEVHVRLHEPRDHRGAFGVEHAVRPNRQLFGLGAHGLDAPATNQDRAVRGRVVAVAGQHRATPDEEIHAAHDTRW